MPSDLRVDVLASRPLVLDDGSPVRAASAVARLGDGWLIASDDTTFAAWVRPTGVLRVRVFPPVDGLDEFSEAAGTKQLKPDVEAALTVEDGADGSAVLLLGSGSTPRRRRGALVRLGPDGPDVTVGELDHVYEAVRRALGSERLNLEGACVVGDRLRWFSRHNRGDRIPSASVDVGLAGLLAALSGREGDPVTVGGVHRYALGAVGGVDLGITDAVALADGRLVLSAAAEASDTAVDDGAVLGSALVLLDGDRVAAVSDVPLAADGSPWKIEGLAVLAERVGEVDLLAVTDADDPLTPSIEVTLRVVLPA